MYQSLSLARSADQTVQPLKPERNARARPASRPGNRDPGMRQASDPMLVDGAGSPAKRTTETKPGPESARVDAMRIAATWFLVAFLLCLIALEPLLRIVPGFAPTSTNILPPTQARVIRPLTQMAPGRQTDRAIPELDDRYDRD
ncbi:MAG TPA: hypothetical protein VGB82_16170 [Alphaproteobacteria bacterium]